jgi:hypothetical protein
MEIEQETNPNQESNLNLETIEKEKFVITFSDELLDLEKEKRKMNYKYILKKGAKIYIIAYIFKVFFKICRNLDKSLNSSLSFDHLLNIVLNVSNIKYSLFILLIKMSFRIFRILLRILKLDNIVEYKRINFIFGLLTNLFLIPLGKKSTLCFYTILYYFIKNILSLFDKHKSVKEGRVYKESKNLYYIGLASGFILVSLVVKEYRDDIKILKYFI